MPQYQTTAIPEDVFAFNDLSLLSDGLQLLRTDRLNALSTANHSLVGNDITPFTEADFGIPDIDRLLQQIAKNL